MSVTAIVHVEPESLLELNVTCTAPGLGAIEPLNTTAEPTETEDRDRVSEIDVDVRKFAISVIGPFIVISQR
jgi:hypothetical protein